jgi:hypothetical protein
MTPRRAILVLALVSSKVTQHSKYDRVAERLGT